MATFTILALCLVGAVRADRCCYQSDCKKGYRCDGAGWGCSRDSSKNGYCKLKDGCCYQSDCVDGKFCDGAKTGCSVASSRNGGCVPKKPHGAKVGFNSDYKCQSGQEQCAYCSSTCKTGCRVVPNEEGCTYTTDCKYGHYCEWSAAYSTLFCQGTCTVDCKDFSKEDTQDVCEAQEALAHSIAAYMYFFYPGRNKNCCGDTTINALVNPLQDLTRHKGSKATMGGMKEEPFGISGHIGSTIFVSLKGSTETADMISNLKTWATEFKVQDWKLAGTQPHLYAHGGFVGFYDGIKVSIFKHVEEMAKKFSATEIKVSGHSMGGALANLAAVDLAAKYPNVKVSLWTFAAPRVFRGDTNPKKFEKDKDSARNAHKILSKKPNTMHRYLANGDPVPSLPSERTSFMHTSDGLELNAGGKARHCSLDHYTTKLWGVIFDQSKFKQHFPDGMFRELKRLNPSCKKRAEATTAKPAGKPAYRCCHQKDCRNNYYCDGAKMGCTLWLVVSGKLGECVAKKPAATTAKPAETTAKPDEEPADTTAKSADTTAKPAATTAKSADTTAKPVQEIVDAQVVASSTTNFSAVTLVFAVSLIWLVISNIL